MFRFLDNLPEVYISESRDFQVLSRVSDILFSGLKYDIDSMVNILDATLVKDLMLELLCTRIGFTPRIEIDAQVLKYIVASFPYIMKYKGTKLGIKLAVNTILKAENILLNTKNAADDVLVDIVSKKVENDLRSDYTVYIYTALTIFNTDALAEIFRYVLPAGFTYKLLLKTERGEQASRHSIVRAYDSLNALEVTPKLSSSIRSSNDQYDDSMENRVVGAYDTLLVYSSNAETVDEESVTKVIENNTVKANKKSEQSDS